VSGLCLEFGNRTVISDFPAREGAKLQYGSAICTRNLDEMSSVIV